MLRFYSWNGGLPEFRRCRETEARKPLPGVDENVIEQEHSHIATETIASFRQGTEQLDHHFLGESFRSLSRALHEQLRLQTEPGVIDTEMVGHKIQHQLHAVAMEFGAKLRQSLITAEGFRNVIIGNGIR